VFSFELFILFLVFLVSSSILFRERERFSQSKIYLLHKAASLS
jgi:hypothetical protein